MLNEQVDGKALERLRRLFTADTPLALIAADVDRVQSYVFESAKLAEMRGASLLLDLLNVRNSDEKDVWGDLEVAERPVKGIRQMLLAEFPKTVVIYTSGGGAMIVSEWARAPEIKERIEKLYVETTLTATITVVYEPVRLADLERKPAATDWSKSKMATARGEASRLLKDNSSTGAESERGRFSELYAALGYQLRRAKQSKLTAPLFEVSSFTERCGYCHFRPACAIAPEVDERPICQVCLRKRQDRRQDDDIRAAQSFYLNGFKKYLERREAEDGSPLPYEQNWANVESPPDLKAIAEAAGGRANNFVGIIYADGNDMGAQLEGLKTADDLESFADEVRATMEQAVFSGLGTLLDGPYDCEREYRRRDGQKRTRPIKHHPFEIITIGGDDVYLIVPADVALELAQHICRSFEQANQGRNLTLAAGVLLTDVNTPIYLSRQIVKGLLKNAKQLSKANPQTQSAVDFQVITTDTAITEDISGFRKKAYRNQSGEGLTTRPLTLDQLEALLGLVRGLKDSSFPKSQLYSLREAVVRGPLARTANFYYYQQARNEQLKKQYAPLHTFLSANNSGADAKTLPFWRADKDWLETNYVTPIVDIVEIYDFVRETAGNQKRSRHEAN